VWDSNDDNANICVSDCILEMIVSIKCPTHLQFLAFSELHNEDIICIVRAVLSGAIVIGVP